MSLSHQWSYDTGKCVDASPVIVDSTESGAHVYIGSHSHDFCCVCLSSGERVWNVKLHDRVESSACVSDDGQWLIVGEWIAGGG